jgi:predicted nuclease of predicted toxin-antitoxin system
MRFLLDENIPPSLALLLKIAGHEARHVVEIGYTNTPDFKISAFAAQSGEIILTHDTDFGTILALSGDSKPSVILFRLQATNNLTYINLLEKHLSEFEENLLEGALVVIDEEKIRVRMLPIKR